MSELNQGSEQQTQNSINETGGIPEIEVSLEVSGMTQTPVDKTLTISDMAADAKAVGDKFADVDSDIYNIETDISGLSAKTALDIPMSDEQGADTIAATVNGALEDIAELQAQTGDDIPITAGTGVSPISTVVHGITEDVSGLQTDLAAVESSLEALTAETIPYTDDEESRTIKGQVEYLTGQNAEAISDLTETVGGISDDVAEIQDDLTEMTDEEIEDIFDEVFGEE